jgi:hypothetical protein
MSYPILNNFMSGVVPSKLLRVASFADKVYPVRRNFLIRLKSACLVTSRGTTGSKAVSSLKGEGRRVSGQKELSVQKRRENNKRLPVGIGSLLFISIILKN